MMDLLNKLYSYEYFGLYLIISIIVLVILFIIILFFGKKDQKVREIEATKKLQQINNDAFKEESEIKKVEVTPANEDLLNDTVIVPVTQDNEVDVMKTVDEEDKEEIPEPILPSVEDVTLEMNEEVKEDIVDVNSVVLEKKEDIIVNEIEEVSPLLDKIEEKPFMFSDVNENIEHIKEEVPKIEQVNEEKIEEDSVVSVPVFNFDEIVKDVNIEKEEIKEEVKEIKRPEIFSSVYVPLKEEEKEIPKKDDEELDFEMPKLKEEADKVNDMPVLNNYNLDSISLETYDINK